jgi:phage gp16-like protein
MVYVYAVKLWVVWDKMAKQTFGKDRFKRLWRCGLKHVCAKSPSHGVFMGLLFNCLG